MARALILRADGALISAVFPLLLARLQNALNSSTGVFLVHVGFLAHDALCSRLRRPTYCVICTRGRWSVSSGHGSSTCLEAILSSSNAIVRMLQFMAGCYVSGHLTGCHLGTSRQIGITTDGYMCSSNSWLATDC